MCTKTKLPMHHLQNHMHRQLQYQDLLQASM